MGKVVDALIEGTPLGKLAWDAIGVDAWWEVSVGKYVRDALIPIPDDDFGNEAMSQQQMLRSPTEARRSIYGKAMVSGPIVFVEETGTDNEFLHLVIPLAAHQCDAVLEIYFDDERVYQNGSLDAAYNEHARINIHLGAQTAADSDLLAECEHWTASHIGLGITYLYVRLKHDPEFYANGLPNIKALVQGKPLYDPRKDSTVGGSGSHRWDDVSTWEWSDNWALCVLDYTRFESGVGALASEIDLASYALAANDSDQLVEYDDEGNTEKRYTCNGTFTQSMTPASVLDKLLTAGAGMQTYSSGKYQLFSGVYQGPHLLTLGEADLAGEVEVRPFNTRAQLCNAVRGTFVDPENFYQPTDFAPYESDYYRAQDNGEYIDHDIDLPFTQSAYTAQRLAKLYLELNRAGQQIVVPLNMIGLSVSVGQVVELDLPRLGIKTEYQVMDWLFDFGQPIKVTLRETTAALFEYDKGSYTDRKLTPVLNLPSSKRVPTVGGVVWTPMGDDANWQGLLSWSAPGGNSAYRYRLEVSDAQGAVVYQATIDATQHHIPKLDAGNYIITLWAVNLFANRSNVPATIAIGADAPPAVTGILVDAGALELTLRPQTVAITATTTEFEVKGGLSSDIANALFIGQGKEVIWPSRHANTQYFVWARATNNYGFSAWFGPIIAHTNSDKSALVELLGDTFEKYTWFAWAEDNQGTGFTTNEAIGDGKPYMGIATDKKTASPSGNWQDYTWSKIQTEIPELFTPEEQAALDEVASGNMPSGNGQLESTTGSQDKAATAQAQAEANAALDALNKANSAQAAAEVYALAKANLAETTAKAYADGVVSDEEARAIADAQAKADAAKNAAIVAAAADAQIKANSAQSTAEAYALAKANLAETTAKAYADGVVSDEEARAIADAQAKADAAKNAAIAAAAADAQTKVDSVQIGGVNLFENSANITVDRNGISEHGYFSSIQHVIDKLKNDEPITISFDVESVFGNFLRCYDSNQAGERVFSPIKEFYDFGPSKKRLSFTTKIINNNGTINSPGNTFIEFYSLYDTDDYWKISKLKIERGTKATDWSPAPEDHYDYTDAAKTSAEAYALAKANLAETTAKAYADGVVNDEEARAIADAQAKADAAKNAAIAAAAIDAQAKANTAINDAKSDPEIGNNFFSGGVATIARPSGGEFSSNSSTTVGAIKIQLPKTYSSTMLSFFVDVFDYRTGYSFTVAISGYNYIGSGSWINVSARILGDISTNYTVRFGDAGGKCCVWIGELSTHIYYPKIVVRDLKCGYSSHSVSEWKSGWAVSIVQAFGNVNQTVINALAGYQNTQDKANIAQAAAETYALAKANLAEGNAISAIALGNFTADIGLISTLFSNSGLFNQLKAKSASFGGLTSETIAALAIATNHLQAGAVTADKVTASTALIQKLIADTGLFNQLKAQIAAFGGLTATEIKADTALINKLVGTSALFNDLVARLAVFGGLTANSIASDAILGRHIKAGERIESPIIEGGQFRNIGPNTMKVESETPFGPDSLVEWRGPKLLVGSEPDWANLRKSNATRWTDSNGNEYFGGSLSAGILRTGVTNPDKNFYVIGSYPVIIGPFATNGSSKSVVVAFVLNASYSSSSYVSNPTQPSLSWQLQRKIGTGSWATVASGTFSGTTSVSYDAELSRYTTEEYCSGSSTYTDNSTSTSDFSYRVKIISQTRYHAVSNVNQQTLTVVSTEE